MFHPLPNPATKPRTLRRRALAQSLWADADLPSDLVERLWLGDAERLLYSAVPLQVKQRCTAVRLDHPAGTFLLKRHTWGALGRTLRSVWRASVARSSMRLANRLADLGIPTPRARACLEQRFGPFGYRSYLVSDYVAGTSLYHFIRFHEPSREELEHVAQQVAAIWRQFVARKISHNDMKPENFIVDPALRVWVIDLERLRVHLHPSRMRRRQLGDVRTFLHPRAWRNRPEARRIFHAAFLQAARGQRFCDAIADFETANYPSPAHEDTSGEQNFGDERLNVLVLCDDSNVGNPKVERTIQSVKDFADEIILVAPEMARRAQHPWILVLHPGEEVTPLLAIDIEEALADRGAADAYRIAIDELSLGCRAPSPEAHPAPVRLFHKWRCAYSVVGGTLAISAGPERTGQLDGPIQCETCASVADFIAELNTRSTDAAAQRFSAGNRANVVRATFAAVRHFAAAYLARGGYQHGWTGFQSSVLGALGVWLEEAKLWQLAHEFRPSTTGHAIDPAGALDSAPTLINSSSVPIDRRKAA